MATTAKNTQNEDSTESTSTYYDTRYSFDPKRQKIWSYICKYMQQWVPTDGATLELGAGYCDWSNQIQASDKLALDIDKEFEQYAAPGVQTLVAPCTDLKLQPERSRDVIFASNLLEHIPMAENLEILGYAYETLKVGGRVILMQPNFRLKPGRYFDDYTHVTVFSDSSLTDVLKASGFEIERMFPKFLPLTMKSSSSSLGFLVPYYLRSPLKPMAGQMLAVARKAAK